MAGPGLEERLKVHSALFASMAELIPHHHVVEVEEKEKESDGDGVVNGFSVEHVQSISLSALQERLKEKIEGLHRKRNNADANGGQSERTEEEIAQKRKKRMETRKRKKGQRQREKLSKKKGSGKSSDQKVGETSTRPSVIDDTGRMVFSKFDFSTNSRREVKIEEDNPSKKKDYKKLLAKAEAAQKKLEAIKDIDERRGEELAKTLMWQKALDMARGTKTKDDVKLLKKSAKRVEKRKKKSSKEWDERKRLEKMANDKRQAKRKANIDERKEQMKSKKMKKMAKKGKGRTPGF